MREARPIETTGDESESIYSSDKVLFNSLQYVSMRISLSNFLLHTQAICFSKCFPFGFSRMTMSMLFNRVVHLLKIRFVCFLFFLETFNQWQQRDAYMTYEYKTVSIQHLLFSQLALQTWAFEETYDYFGEFWGNRYILRMQKSIEEKYYLLNTALQ